LTKQKKLEFFVTKLKTKRNTKHTESFGAFFICFVSLVSFRSKFFFVSFRWFRFGPKCFVFRFVGFVSTKIFVSFRWFRFGQFFFFVSFRWFRFDQNFCFVSVVSAKRCPCPNPSPSKLFYANLLQTKRTPLSFENYVFAWEYIKSDALKLCRPLVLKTFRRGAHGPCERKIHLQRFRRETEKIVIQ